MLLRSNGGAGRLALGFAAALLASTAASAQALEGGRNGLTFSAQSMAGNQISGETNGLSWSAQSTVVGVTPTGAGTIVIPPSPTVRLGPGPAGSTYLPDPAQHSGVVALIMQYNNGSAFICSGSLLSDRRSIATAGHCVSSGGGVPDADLVSTTAYFYDYATQPDTRVPFNPDAVDVAISGYSVHADYTGEVIDQNDIAILTLNELAPAFAQSYEVYTGGDLTGDAFNVAGYGGRSEVGGATGISALPSTGFLREGDNEYDYRWGADEFGGFFTDIIGGTHFFGGVSEIEYSYLSDFDTGLAVNSQACRIGSAVAGAPFGCTNGLGAREVGIAGGDSGGPGFINGQLASINSYGLTFGVSWGDSLPGLQSSFGEFSGYVPTFIHEDFINDALTVPEPGTWALMIGGFGLAGGALRRRRATVTA